MSNPIVKTLKGGLRVVLVPCEAESVAVGFFVASGSRHEKPKVAGISHFIEHMLFKGTPTRRPIDISHAIEGRGGNFNAFTGEESTCYYAHLPYEYLDEAVDILSDMFLNASFPKDEFNREKQVVLEEIKMYADDADSVAMENLQRALFPGHPLGTPVAGSAATLEPLKPLDLHAYMESHYTAKSTIVVIVGRFDEGKAIATIEEKLANPLRDKKSRSSRVVATKKVDFAIPVVNDIMTTKEVNQAQLAIGYRTFGIGDKRKYAGVMLDAILGRGMSSRLFQQIREKRGLSYDISSRFQFFMDAGMFVVAAGVDPKKLDLTRDTIERELKKMCEKRVGATELNRVKEHIVGNFRLSHERVVAKLFFYGSTMLSFGSLLTTDEQVAGIRAVTAEEVMSVANDIFLPENRSESRVLPKE